MFTEGKHYEVVEVNDRQTLFTVLDDLGHRRCIGWHECRLGGSKSLSFIVHNGDVIRNEWGRVIRTEDRVRHAYFDLVA